MSSALQYTKREYFGGPLDGDKRTGRELGEWWSVDGRQVHHYGASHRGMEHVTLVEAVPQGRELLLANVGVER